MTFRESLDRHLEAIRRRAVHALAETVDADEVVLVTADGDVSTDPERFLELHREWFATDGWTLDAELLHTREVGDLATAVLRLDYREDRPDGSRRQESILSLVFRRRDGRWVLVQDQNTPIADGSSG
ncbi:MAG TPA: nuclear transport factor 2 family protein [Actinomycetota bacterium]|nr:nuclear transport factor 2 family protein [Actinomycetota bacterium]